MDLRIETCLPCFLFPDVFAARLPKEFEPFRPTPKEECAFRMALMEIEGLVTDYIFSMTAIVMHYGKVREARRYTDGSTFVRFDTSEHDGRNNPCVDTQFLVHLDRENHLLHYTKTFVDMKPSHVWTVELTQSRFRCVLDKPDDVLQKCRHCHVGEKMWIRPNAFPWAGLCLHRKTRDTCDFMFNFDHPPLLFRVPDRHGSDIGRLLRLYMEEGVMALTHEADLIYGWIPSEHEKIGLYQRLLFHRFRAQFAGNEAVIGILDRLNIIDEPSTTALWMPRLGATWADIVRHLFHLARGPECGRLDANGNHLSPLDCDRIVAFAALEGCPEAMADMQRLFGRDSKKRPF